ncbi:hypothetical protein ACJRO7_029853 [Eucalyptus globulus]|uniref:Sieve element occlusion N-terminal domain-containing protein n=1 Tax=Eucalyptus globulus TaxID=34317 RepID=A0ABD3JME2_EUCGL
MAFRGNGGSNMANGMASSDIINFIDNQQFLELVLGKQSYDSTEEEKCSVNDLLQITNNIFAEAIPPVKKDGDTRKVGMGVSESIVPSNISHLIKWIGCQMTCEVMHGKDLEERLLAIFLKLSSYRRTTQVALVLAALALQYGEFWYISEAPFALSTGVLKGLSALKKKLISDENKKAAITPFNKVVNDLLELTTRLLDLYKLVNERDRKPVPELVKTGRTIPRWSCETIITILATGNFFARLTDVNYKFEERDLTRLTSSVWERKRAVLTAVGACEKQIARMEYQKYVEKVRVPVDIVDFLTRMIAVENSLQDLIVTGPNDAPVKFESFRNKSVLLIISDLKISTDDITTLGSVHNYTKGRLDIKYDSNDGCGQFLTEKETLYELVWVPVVDAKHDNKEELQKFKSLMPWAFRVNPLKMNEWAATYIKEEWHFKQETMVVVFNTDAMPMLRIWGTDVYPYTGTESTHPWREPRNWVQLVNKEPIVSPETSDAIRRTEYTLFYGGTPATNIAKVTSKILNLRVVHIENTKRFFIHLRSCLIYRFQALQILKPEIEPLNDCYVSELCEAYKACQGGGFAILTKGSDLLMLHVGPFDTTWKQVTNLIAQGGRINLAKVFKKKNDNVQEWSACMHVYIPNYTGLRDLRCPFCS